MSFFTIACTLKFDNVADLAETSELVILALVTLKNA
mgnify:CR=1 FL=1